MANEQDISIKITLTEMAAMQTLNEMVAIQVNSDSEAGLEKIASALNILENTTIPELITAIEKCCCPCNGNEGEEERDTNGGEEKKSDEDLWKEKTKEKGIENIEDGIRDVFIGTVLMIVTDGGAGEDKVIEGAIELIVGAVEYYIGTRPDDKDSSTEKPTGATGPSGVVGPAGPTGPIGPNDVIGPVGPTGPIGVTGALEPAVPTEPTRPTEEERKAIMWEIGHRHTVPSNLYNEQNDAGTNGEKEDSAAWVKRHSDLHFYTAPDNNDVSSELKTHGKTNITIPPDSNQYNIDTIQIPPPAKTTDGKPVSMYFSGGLINSLTINTQTITQSYEKVKEELTKALLEAASDAQLNAA